MTSSQAPAVKYPGQEKDMARAVTSACCPDLEILGLEFVIEEPGAAAVAGFSRLYAIGSLDPCQCVSVTFLRFHASSYRSPSGPEELHLMWGSVLNAAL